MNTENKEQEIKIKIVKEEEPKKERKFFNPEKLAVFFFYALVFLMPIFALPLAVAPLASGKAILFFGGILLTAFFWILSALIKGSVKIPKSVMLISLGAVVSVWLASALSSGNANLSLSGKLYDLDTFSAMFAAGLALFFGSMIFQSEKKVFSFYFLLFCSSFVVFLFQLLHLVFGINIIPFNIFPYTTSNLIGGWNDFSIFFGFIGLVSLAFLETAKLGKGRFVAGGEIIRSGYFFRDVGRRAGLIFRLNDFPIGKKSFCFLFVAVFLVFRRVLFSVPSSCFRN